MLRMTLTASMRDAENDGDKHLALKMSDDFRHQPDNQF